MDPAAAENSQEAHIDLQDAQAEEPEPSTSRYPSDYRYIDWPTSLPEKLTRQDLYLLANQSINEWSFRKPLESIGADISSRPESYEVGRGTESCTVHVVDAIIKSAHIYTLTDPWRLRAILACSTMGLSVIEQLAQEATNFAPPPPPGGNRSEATLAEIVQSRLTAWWESLCAAKTCSVQKQPSRTTDAESEHSFPGAGVTVHSEGMDHPNIDKFVYREKISAGEWLEVQVSMEEP